jgi:hypothetical protein
MEISSSIDIPSRMGWLWLPEEAATGSNLPRFSVV